MSRKARRILEVENTEDTINETNYIEGQGSKFVSFETIEQGK